MKSWSARMASALVFALAARAADGQTAGGYVPARQTPMYRPTIGQDTGRYPLPQAQPSAPAAAPQALGPYEQNAPHVANHQPIAAPPPQLREPVVRTDLFQPGMTVARVGDACIFYGDILPTVNMELEAMLSKAASEAERREIAGLREELAKRVLPQAVQSKMLYLEFERDIMKKGAGADAKQRAEAKSKMEKNIRQVFERVLNDYREKVASANPEQLAKMLASERAMVRMALIMKDRQIESYGELDLALRQYGTTLDQQITLFGERQLGYEVVRKHLNGQKYEVTHEEMLDYYMEHAADYAVPARARFEILTVRFASFPNRAEAWKQISEMGNAVYLGGTPFAAVAKKFSQEPNAEKGGLYDWVNQGALASQAIDQAIFEIEINKLSQIIEDENGYHIVRVKEREAPTQVSFVEAQPEIKKAIEAKKRSAEQQKFLEQIQARTQVWTIYDPPAESENATAAPALRR